jgi:hypothetical protein
VIALLYLPDLPDNLSVFFSGSFSAQVLRLVADKPVSPQSPDENYSSSGFDFGICLSDSISFPVA